LDLIVKTDSVISDSLAVNDISSNIPLNDSITNITHPDSALIYTPDNELITKQDSALELSNDKDNPIDKAPEYDIVEVGDGVFTLKPRDENSGPISENHVDSLLKTELFLNFNDKNVANVDSNMVVDKSGNYEITEVSDGIFTLKKNGTVNKINDEISDKLIDSLYTVDKFASVIDKNSKTASDNKKNDYFHENYYTVRVFISSKSDILLKDHELTESLRVEKSITGKINYYYGKFSKKTSAVQAQNYLRRKGVKNTKILKVSAFR